MYPYHHFHHAAAGFRGPRRLIWFLIGAGTAAWFLKYKDANERQFGHCRRPQVQQPQAPESQDTWHSAEPHHHRSFPPLAHRNYWSSNWEAGPTPEEKEKIAVFSSYAADSVTELTETTLDSILNTAQALKQNLVEYRLQREREQKERQRQLEEQQKNPPRLV
ncbi:hypothetical protein BDQ17DRAFT_1540556 [Cyathus striatus]|nr:hypothetical protein BDQ17DRAFT_1540556 [Cyathus striatus]